MPSSPFIGEDGEPRLVECAVLYFDLLGVSAMAQGAEAEDELLRFNRTIRDAFPYPIGAAAANEDDHAYPATVFSDAVVAAVPIPSEVPAATQIFHLAFEVAKLQTELATREYFARGAITLGKIHFYDGLLFGPALVEAVALERMVAVDPRIVLSPRAAAALLGVRGTAAPILGDEDRMLFVDYLTGAFQTDPGLDLPTSLRRHRSVVAGQLKQHAANFGRWSKHRWIAEYHNATCATYKEVLAAHGGFESFLVDSIHTERRFDSPLAPVDDPT
jgi:hypothetical protein